MASYPSSIVTLATHNDNTDTIFAADINTPNAEIVAIETGLLNGFQHNLIPDADDTRSLGSSSKRWLKLWTQDIDFDGTVTAGGLIDASAAAAGQIKFPSTQNPSSNVNTLDDYSEGTWTPVIGGAGGTSGQTYANQVGHYIKIGKLVTVFFYVQLSAKGTITGNVQLSGLPITADATSLFIPVSSIQWVSLATTWVSVVVGVNPNTTTAVVQGATTAASANNTSLTTSDISNATVLIGTLTYQSAS